jgi:hypothetical protein
MIKPHTIRYEVWEYDNATTLSTSKGIKSLKKTGSVSLQAKLIHVIYAATGEEASAIFNLRMGYESYKPLGESELCPKGCGSYYYPLGSGECPYCGRIS